MACPECRHLRRPRHISDCRFVGRGPQELPWRRRPRRNQVVRARRYRANIRTAAAGEGCLNGLNACGETLPSPAMATQELRHGRRRDADRRGLLLCMGLFSIFFEMLAQARIGGRLRSRVAGEGRRVLHGSRFVSCWVRRTSVGVSAVQPAREKYFPSRLGAKHPISPAVSFHRGAYRDRHGRGMGCGGRGGVARGLSLGRAGSTLG
jgi:hypothetical protein